MDSCTIPQLSRRGQQNQSLSFFKLIAAILVVFIHARFPGDVGLGVQAVARSGVGGFFAISGFFSLGADKKKLEKRWLGILKLLLAGIAIELLYGCVSVEFLGAYPDAFQGSIVAYLRSMVPTQQEWAAWLLVSSCPIQTHLWYLSAMLFCYGVLWGYTVFFGEEKVSYRPLYLVSAGLLCVHLALGPMAVMAGQEYREGLVRNGLLFGLPMFSLGMFLRQYGEWIWKNYGLTAKGLWVTVLAGILLTLLECFGNYPECDLFVGTLLVVTAVLLLAARYPVLCPKPWVEKLAHFCGKLSVGIYLTHLVVVQAWILFFGEPGLLPVAMAWWYPVLVVLASGLLSGCWLALMWLIRKK